MMEHGLLPPSRSNQQMSVIEKKVWRAHLWNHIVITDGEYFICKICDDRLDKTGTRTIESHFLKRHGIKPGQMINNYASVRTYATQKLSPAMSEYVSSHFDADNDQNIWHCKHCSSTMFGRKRDPISMDTHLRKEHPEVYKQHSSNSVIDDRDRPGFSGASSNINSDIMPVIKTEEESDNDTEAKKVACIFIPSDSEDESSNPNLCNVEVNITECNETFSYRTPEEMLQDEDTLDLRHKFETKSETCLPDESKQIVENVKREETSDDDHSVDHANEPRISAANGLTSNSQRPWKLSRWEYPHSSTNDEQNVKTADESSAKAKDEDKDDTAVKPSVTKGLNAESSRSGEVDGNNFRKRSSIASSKRRLSSQPISPKKAKRQSTDTDPVNGRSLHNSSDSLPDSNSTPSDTSSDMQFFTSIMSKFQNLNPESQRNFKKIVSEALCELEESNTNKNQII